MDAMTTTARPGLEPGLWQQLADHVSHLVWMTDERGEPFWFNRRCMEYGGLDQEELIGAGWQSLVHPDDIDRARAEWVDAVKNSRPYESLYRLRSTDGAYRHFLARAEPLRDSEGRITHWFGTSTDISEQIEAEHYSAFLVRLEKSLREARGNEDGKRQVIRLLGEELGADRVHFSDLQVDLLQARVGDEYLAPGVGSVAGTHQLSEEVLELYGRGEPIVIADYREHPAFAKDRERPEIASLPVRAVLDIPLVRNNRLVAVLSVHQTVPRQWTEKEVELALATAERSWDMVERAKAEQALNAANARFRAVLDNTEMAVFLLDDQANCIYANAAAEALTGYSFDEMKDAGPLHDLIHHSHPDLSAFPMDDCPIGKAIPNRAKVQGEEMFVAKDGSFYPVYFSASPVLDKSGDPVGTVLEARNIADERARKAELETSEAKFRTTAEAVPGLLFVTNAAGENSYVNQFYREYTGLDGDLVGDWWRGVIHPDDVDMVMAATEHSRRTGEDFRLDYRIRRHDGEFRWHSTKASPTRNSEGRIERWVGVSLDIHDRREAEEQARAAAEELEAIYATAPVGLAVLDRELCYVRINERLAEINGISAADHIGRSVQDLLPELAKQADAVLRRVLGGEELRGIELTGETPAQPGVIRVWRENLFPIRDHDGSVSGVAISAEEVTEEKAAEHALAQSEAQFRTLAEALPGMLFIAKDGGNTYVNETFAIYTGRPKEALLGSGWIETLHPDDHSRCLEIWTEAGQSGRPYEAECRFRRHDGIYRWHAVRALRIPTPEQGVNEYWLGTCVDIHDARMAGQEIAAAEARYRAVFEQAGVGVALVSPDGPFLEINDRYCQILRRNREEVLGNGWKHITHPEDLDDDVAHVEAMLRGEIDSYSIEKRYVAPDGSDIWVHLTVAAQRDENGKVLFFIPVVEDHNARKQAEAALRASEERYRALFESMEQGFCTVQVSFDEEGRPSDYRFTELNPAFSRHTGLSQDVLHQSVREAVPGLEQSWFDRYGEVASSGISIRFIDHAEPLGRWFEVYAFPIGSLGDRNVAILFSDVTERVTREKALRDSEREMRLRLNAIPQMVWSTTADGHHDFYNDRWYEFTGTPHGSTDGAGWSGMFHPEDQPRAWQRWKESLRTGEPYEIEYRLRHHSGEYRWVLGRALPIRDDKGEIVRWMGTCTDIDDRLAAERALQSSEGRLRAILEAVPVGLIFADAGGRLTGGNQQVFDFIGHDLIESSGVTDYKNDYVAFHADGRQVESEEYPLARALMGEARPELECRIQRGDGTLKWLRYVAAPIRDQEGRITGGVVASIDVDREKRLTEGLEREVEKVIAEREAAQEALRQSQKLEAMGQLTGGVAHDFNNLLTPIIGSLDLLQRKQVLDARTGRLVEGALASAEKARLLVQRLLAFARRQPLQPRAVDVAAVVAEMSELVDSTSGPRVRVLTEIADELPPALADGNQLEMALLNLSVNARDAMPDGGTLTIAARVGSLAAGKRLGLPDKPHVVFSVSDTGTGMDEQTRRRAIEPFFSTKGIGKGTGLGLSMVHGLAAQLGGALDIRSALGMGTTIELWLPVASGLVAAGSSEPAETERQGAGTALLVDDEELVRTSTAGMLTDLGYLVVEADSGEAAAALVAKGLRPDILVTDQLMPGLSGTDLAVRLRETLPQLSVLIVSGYADIDSLSPAFPHLSKPFRQAELAAALDKMVAP